MIVRRMAGPRSHWSDFDVLRKDMLRLLDQVGLAAHEFQPAGVFPPVNLTQDREHYYLRCELPGMRPEDLEISVVGRTVTLSGERKPAEAEGVSYHRRERLYGRFSRSITLPGEVDSETINANLSDGLLTVKMPKPEKLKPRQISIKAS